MLFAHEQKIYTKHNSPHRVAHDTQEKLHAHTVGAERPRLRMHANRLVGGRGLPGRRCGSVSKGRRKAEPGLRWASLLPAEATPHHQREPQEILPKIRTDRAQHGDRHGDRQVLSTTDWQRCKVAVTFNVSHVGGMSRIHQWSSWEGDKRIWKDQKIQSGYEMKEMSECYQT